MKCEAHQKSDFNPVTLTITLETQEEVDAFYLMCNTGKICGVLKRNELDLILPLNSLKRFTTKGGHEQLEEFS